MPWHGAAFAPGRLLGFRAIAWPFEPQAQIVTERCDTHRKPPFTFCVISRQRPIRWLMWINQPILINSRLPRSGPVPALTSVNFSSVSRSSLGFQIFVEHER